MLQRAKGMGFHILLPQRYFEYNLRTPVDITAAEEVVISGSCLGLLESLRFILATI